MGSCEICFGVAVLPEDLWVDRDGAMWAVCRSCYQNEHDVGIARMKAAERKLRQIGDLVPTLRNLPEMYRHLVMDTPKDQEVHRKVTETSDRVLDLVESILGGE